MSDYPKANDAIQLREHLNAAISVRKRILWDGDYPEYPGEIGELMRYISTSLWCNHQYKPTEVRGILTRLESADLDEIRSVLTAISRSERFCTGAWKSALDNGKLDPVVRRAEQLTKA